MTKETLSMLFRAALSLVGAYLVGHNLFGTAVTESLWSEIGGGLMVVGSFVWSVFSKTLTVEMTQSAVKQLMMILGMFSFSSKANLQPIFAFITSTLPIWLAWLGKKKSDIIAANPRKIEQLKGLQ